MLRSFRLKIGLMSLCLSGLLLVAFGFFAVSVLNRVGIERIDRELLALANTRVRQSHPHDHWRRFDESFRSMYGSDESKQFIIRVTQQTSGPLYVSETWPEELSPDDLPLFLTPPPVDEQSAFSLETAPGGDWRISPMIGELLRPRRELAISGPVYATLGSPGKTWRAITIANEEVTVGIALNLAGLRAETHRFRQVMFIGIPLGLLLMATGGWIIGHMALRPVDRIARTAKDMTARGLDARISADNADEEFSRLINVINDMLERLDRSFYQATRFSADAAHELKTPLAILQAQIERALQRAPDASPEQREYAEQLDEVQRLKVILKKLLLLSQTDAGQLTLCSETLNLADLTRAVASDVELLAPDRKTTVDAPAELSVQGDADLMNQVIENLVSNAIKFGEDDGRIDIVVREHKGQGQVTVANTGPTIPEQDSERIFERFFRVDPARSRKTEGTGLGLSLAREIARAHGGDVTLAQSTQNLTRFALTLPLTQP